MVVVTTEGSRWEFWETEHLYRRSPLHEASRSDPSWGGPEAGPLRDHVWHEFSDWRIVRHALGVRLLIELPSNDVIRAPRPNHPVGMRHACTRCSPGTGNAA